jgi:hypothetical protein
MKFTLADGTYAHLRAIVQTSDYRCDYLQQPPNAAEEIKRIAKMHTPSNCWPSAPLVLLCANLELLDGPMESRKLPSILCVGHFVSYRKREGKTPKATFLYLVWMQNEFLPYLNPENESLFRNIDWNKYIVA